MVMKHILPHVIDMPMSLGDHLHELRRRLMAPIIAIVVVMIVGIIYQATLKIWLVWPLKKAIAIIGPQMAGRLKIPTEGYGLLTYTGLAESTMLSMSLAMNLAVVVTFPILLFQIWRFIVVGLKENERRLGFLFVPLAVILFYLGGFAGFFWGLPYFYAWVIAWTADDPTALTQLFKASEYHDFFINMTICFGLIMDIPWAVMVLVRTGLVSIDRITRMRRIVVIVNLVIAAMITPTTDLISLSAMFVPMQLLFEIGLIASRICFRKQIAARRAAEAAEAKTAAEHGLDLPDDGHPDFFRGPAPAHDDPHHRDYVDPHHGHDATGYVDPHHGHDDPYHGHDASGHADPHALTGETDHASPPVEPGGPSSGTAPDAPPEQDVPPAAAPDQPPTPLGSEVPPAMDAPGAGPSPTSFGATGLPDGLTVNATTGVISGTPTTAGITNVTISATNDHGTGIATLVLTITAGTPAAPVITSTLAKAGTVGTELSYTITASSGPTSFDATGLPPAPDQPGDDQR